jgi:hypothetical protein
MRLGRLFNQSVYLLDMNTDDELCDVNPHAGGVRRGSSDDLVEHGWPAAAARYTGTSQQLHRLVDVRPVTACGTRRWRMARPAGDRPATYRLRSTIDTHGLVV